MVKALFKFSKDILQDSIVIDTTSGSGRWSGLSPFVLNASRYGSKNFENLWQYSKVYPEFLDSDGNVDRGKWEEWRYYGFNSEKAHRYPMGKGKIPCFSLWNGKRLGYIDARKKIYIPIYMELVAETDSFEQLRQVYHNSRISIEQPDLILLDYDAYDHAALGITLRDVANNPNKKCGHAFALLSMLTGEPIL